MSRITTNAASRFVTEYGRSQKSSVVMASACVDILNDGTTPKALVAAVRGAYESKHGAFPSTEECKRFETLVSQRSFAAQLALIVGEDAATDEVAIKAALRVASGALPRKQATAIAEDHRDTNDGPAFARAIDSALKGKKAPTRKVAGTTNPRTEPAAPIPVAPNPDALGFADALRIIDRVIREETDPRVRNEYRKALQARMVKVSQPALTAA